MSPEDADELLKHAEDWPRRQRRYMLEGGTNQIWKCARPGCDWHTIAHSAAEGVENLRRHGRKVEPRALLCSHVLQPTDNYQPPPDFR